MPKIQYEIKNFTQATLEVIQQAEAIINNYLAQAFRLTESGRKLADELKGGK